MKGDSKTWTLCLSGTWVFIAVKLINVQYCVCYSVHPQLERKCKYMETAAAD